MRAKRLAEQQRLLHELSRGIIKLLPGRNLHPR
jgi:hypothetical protein